MVRVGHTCNIFNVHYYVAISNYKYNKMLMSYSNHVSNKFLLALYGPQVIFYLLRQLKVSVADFFCVQLIAQYCCMSIPFVAIRN